MLRKIEIVIPVSQDDKLQDILADYHVLDKYRVSILEDRYLYLITLKVSDSGPLLDEMEKNLAAAEGFRLNLLEVEATLPVPEEEEKEKEEEEEKVAEGASVDAGEEGESEENNSLSISRQELYTDVAGAVALNRNYLIMCFLSAIVATSGVLQGSVAVIIGAMVIAPLLGPNVGLALASTLGDVELGKKALRASLLGTAVSLSIALLIGFILQPAEWSGEVLSRTTLGWGDIAMALASGSAGTLAFTTGAANAVIGVMIAVALMPPLVVIGLLVGAGELALAGGATLLFLSNIICINLSGVLTFLLQGIRPLNWWEEKKARKLTRYSLILWVSLLIILVLILQLADFW